MSGITRNFSQQSVQELRDIIRKNMQDNQWGFFDWFDDTFLMQELNIKNYINNVNEYHAKMIDKHNMGSEEFDRILQRVHTVDENYSARINSLVDQAKALQTRIEQLTKMIDPSVITANPSDFARLADGIDSKYQKVKVQSEARMKQCEASMPVLYDKQWYENVVDSIKTGVNVAGQVGEGIGCGLVDVAKDLVFGVKDTAVGLFNYLTNNPEEENALFIANICVQSEKQNRSVPQFLWDSLTTGIWNGLQASADDFAKGDLKTKSEMATRVLGNLALFLLPATTAVKVGKAGEAIELEGDLSKTLEAEKAALEAEKATELEQSFAQVERESEQAEIAIEDAKRAKEAGKATKIITGTGEVENKAGIPKAKVEEILGKTKYTRPNPTTYLTREYIDNHKLKFKNGATKISYQAPSGYAGPPGGTFVMPTSVADDLIDKAGGDTSELERLLSLKPGDLQQFHKGLRRVI